MNCLSVDQEWENFVKNNQLTKFKNEKCKKTIVIPKVTPIYISTQTKIGYLNQHINLQQIFWNIPIIPYQKAARGVIKKQIKINCETKDESQLINNRIKDIPMTIVNQIKFIDKPTAKIIKYKDIKKINVGLSKKDLTSHRKKIKGAFYNCFVVILRIKYNDIFKEIHIKVFNTGKLEIPGIQNDEILITALDDLIRILQPFIPNLTYNKEVDTVLINSNFTCNYFINRDKLSNILKYKYKMHVNFDPCSYPGIQVKFYYNSNKLIQDGICDCSSKCNKKNNHKKEKHCLEISFMIFRTGSVLIVGHCSIEVIHIIYNFLVIILKEEYENINIENNNIDKKKKKKRKKKKRKTIIMDLSTN